jgi:hypothetical protein
VLQRPRDQPVDFSAHTAPLSSSCCGVQHSPRELLQCVREAAAQLSSSGARASPSGLTKFTLVRCATQIVVNTL